MIKTSKLLIAGFAVIFFLIGFLVYAFEASGASWDDIEKELEGSVIGLGVLYNSSPYVGADDSLYPVPLIIARYKKFYVDNSLFGYVLNDDKNFEFSVVGSLRFMGYEADDSDALSGMEDRNWSLDGGVRLIWKNEYCELGVTALTDCLNEHQGTEIEAVISREFFKGAVKPRIGVSWQNEDLVDYYYGVLGSEVRSGRPAYEGNDAVNYFAGIRLAVPITDKWAVIGDLQYENLDSSINNSPIVDRDKLFRYVLGAVYRF